MSLDHTLLRKLATEMTWDTIGSNIVGTAPKRFVSGLAISSKKRNANGQGFLARGFVDEGVRIPLLANHDLMRPLGKIIRVQVAADERLAFKAELLNSGRLLYAELLWGEIMLRSVGDVSIGPRNLGGPARDGVFDCWTLDEISIVGKGADPFALLDQCWSQAHVVYLREPREVLHWSTLS